MPTPRKSLALVTLACLLATILLHLRPGASIPGGTKLDGGCAPSKSPYLHQNPAISIGAITFCDQGDSDTGQVTIDLPAGAMRRLELVVSGYVDGRNVHMEVQGLTSEPPVPIVLTAKETWTPLSPSLPPSWENAPLRITLSDSGRGHTQWAGIGLRSKSWDRSPLIVPLLLLSVFLGTLVLLAPDAKAPADAVQGGNGSTSTSWRRIAPLAGLALVVLLLSNSLYRNETRHQTPHPDQSIPVKVIQEMHQHGDLNTDWARADLPAYFQACRYNFSGYILASYVAIQAFAPSALDDEGKLIDKLHVFSRICASLTLCLGFLLLYRQLGIGYALIGTAAIAIAPQFYQDAHYPRPEAFSTLIFTLCFGLACLRPQREIAQAALVSGIALLSGFLATVKFTYAAALLLAVPTYALGLRTASRTRQLKRLLPLGTATAIAFLLGFCIGAPAAIADLPGYLQGLEALHIQYSGSHPPHSPIYTGMWVQAGLIAGYYSATLGAPLLVLHAVGYLRKPLAPAKFAFLAVLLITLVGFLPQKVFFERNFSPFIPALILLAIVGIANIQHWMQQRLVGQGRGALLSVLAAAALSVLMLCQSLSVTYLFSSQFSRKSLAQARSEREAREQAALRSIGAVRMERIDFNHVFDRQYPEPIDECVLYASISYNDEWSARYVNELPSNLRSFGRLESAFKEVPVSTLHTYHSAAVDLFYDAAACPLAQMHEGSKPNTPSMTSQVPDQT